MDPIAEKYEAWNPYNYCLDSPLRFSDANGEGPFDRAHWADVGKSALSLAGYSVQMVTGAAAVVGSGGLLATSPAVAAYTVHGGVGYVQSIRNLSNSLQGKEPVHPNLVEVVGGVLGGEQGRRIGAVVDNATGLVSPAGTLKETINATAATLPNGLSAAKTLTAKVAELAREFKDIEPGTKAGNAAADALLRTLAVTAKSDATQAVVMAGSQLTSGAQAVKAAQGSSNGDTKVKRPEDPQQ